jgi:hypothetical protein
MKKILSVRPVFSILLTTLLFGNNALGQQAVILPSVRLQTLEGNFINANTISGDGQPLILVFWDLNDHKSCENLKTLHEIYNDSLLSKKVKMVTICAGVTGANTKIKPFVASNNLTIEVYLDSNGDFRRAIGVSAPHTILYDSQMNVFCQQKGYCVGNQELLCQEIRKCLAAIK